MSSRPVTTIRRNGYEPRKTKNIQYNRTNRKMAQIARKAVNNSNQHAYVTNYLCYVAPLTNDLFMNVAKTYEDFSALAYYPRGILLDLSDVLNTGTNNTLNSGHSHTGNIGALVVCKSQSTLNINAITSYDLAQHTSSVIDGNKYFQHSIWWDMTIKNPDTTGPYRVKMYIVRFLQKRDNLLDFFQGIRAVVPSWVELLEKQEWILAPTSSTDGSDVAHCQAYTYKKKYQPKP